MSSYYEKILATGEVKCIDEEIPFEIPKGWEWCKINNIAFVTKLAGFEYTKYIAGNLKPNGIPLFKGKNVQGGKIIYEFEAYIPESLSNELERSQISKKCLLTPYVGTIGNIGLHYKSGKFHLGSNVGKIEILNPSFQVCLLEEFVHIYLLSQYGYAELTKYKKATAQESISIEAIRDVLLPIPPIQEQQKIVDKYYQLETFLDKYRKLQECLETLNVEIFDIFKKSILQEAIQGKLVSQIDSEGTAQELLEQIKVEKLKLVKEGKLKKSALNDSVIFRGDDNKYYEQVGKSVADISEQIPFDIPETWSWSRGKSIFLPMESEKPKNDFVYIDVDAVNNKKYIIDNPKHITTENAPSRASRKLHENDVLFSMVRPYLKNIALVTDEYKNAIASTGFYVITPSIGIYPQYLYWMMLSSYVVDGLNMFMKGDNSPSINNCHIEEYLYPIPPESEQQRIIAQIEKLFEQLH